MSFGQILINQRNLIEIQLSLVHNMLHITFKNKIKMYTLTQKKKKQNLSKNKQNNKMKQKPKHIQKESENKPNTKIMKKISEKKKIKLNARAKPLITNN